VWFFGIHDQSYKLRSLNDSGFPVRISIYLQMMGIRGIIVNLVKGIKKYK
jgi:hypothetical protein